MPKMKPYLVVFLVLVLGVFTSSIFHEAKVSEISHFYIHSRKNILTSNRLTNFTTGVLSFLASKMGSENTTAGAVVAAEKTPANESCSTEMVEGNVRTVAKSRSLRIAPLNYKKNILNIVKETNKRLKNAKLKVK